MTAFTNRPDYTVTLLTGIPAQPPLHIDNCAYFCANCEVYGYGTECWLCGLRRRVGGPVEAEPIPGLYQANGLGLGFTGPDEHRITATWSPDW